MNRWIKPILIVLLMSTSLVFAEDLVAGNAYIISSINQDPSTTIQPGQKYSLVPQIVVYDGTSQYVGSVTKFSGCYGTRRYINGEDKGECFLGGNATTSAAGLMSASDKAKLDGINLSNYALASHTHDDRYYTESEIDTKLSNINVSSNYINSLGNKTAETGSTKLSTPGLSMQQVYDNGYPTTFGNVINLNGSGEGQILVGWSGTSGAHAGVYVRSQRDVSDADWSPWAEFITSNNIGSQSVNYANSSNYSNSSGSSDYANRVWTQSHNGSWYINSNWNGSVFVTNARENGGSELPIWVNHAGNADTVDGYHIDNILNKIYPVNCVYFNASGTNPVYELGFGSWELIGSKLAVSENVFGNGYALGLTDNNSYGGLVMHHNPSRTAISPKAFGAGQGAWSDDIAGLDRRAFGVPTKAQLGSNLYKSGLVVDTAAIYSWKRIA